MNSVTEGVCSYCLRFDVLTAAGPDVDLCPECLEEVRQEREEDDDE